MASSAEAPEEVGAALADAGLDEATEGAFLRATLCLENADAETPKPLRAAWQYVAESYSRNGQGWLTGVLRKADIQSSQVCLANLALALPPSMESWDTIRSWGTDIEEAYWKQCAISVVRDPSTSANRAVRSLLKAGRPYRALQVICLAEHPPGPEGVGPKHVSPELLVGTLRALTTYSIADERQPPAIGSVSHYVERLFSLLDGAHVEMAVVAQLEFALLPFLEHTERGPKSLVAAIETTPSVFVDLLKMVYRAEGEEARELSELDRASARLAYGLLSNLQVVPGTKWTKPSSSDGLGRRFEGDISFPIGEVDEHVLGSWIKEARTLATESGRLEMCDQKIGEVFAYAPGDREHEWPCQAVRSQIEHVKSEALESGIETGIFNKRGVHWRDRGGKQERLIAQRFRGYATATQGKWPRTSAVLRQLAETFERLARREDAEGLVDEFM